MRIPVDEIPPHGSIGNQVPLFISRKPDIIAGAKA
jgi:hypothetical protein